jgi:hypothetical protein
MHTDYWLDKSYDTRNTITTNKSKTLVLWEYKFKITIENDKRLVQCEFPPYDLYDEVWLTNLINDTYWIYKYAEEMYRDARRMLDEKTPLL